MGLTDRSDLARTCTRDPPYWDSIVRYARVDVNPEVFKWAGKLTCGDGDPRTQAMLVRSAVQTTHFERDFQH